MTSKEMSKLVVKAIEDLKGQSITSLNVSDLTQVTDYMVIVTGTSRTHIKAISNEVVRQAKEAGMNILGVEGKEQAEWVLVDLGAVVVHVMSAPVRSLYNLEELWNFTSNRDEKAEK